MRGLSIRGRIYRAGVNHHALLVRFGPWARNLYLGLPAAFTFALISVVAHMPWWLAFRGTQLSLRGVDLRVYA